MAACAGPAQPDALPSAAVLPGRYALQPGDRIAVRHVGDQAYNAVVTVAPDGTVAVPGLPGPVGAGGQTVEALRDRLVRQLRARDVLIDQALTVSVEEFANQQAFIGGEVRRPGLLELQGSGRTLLQAVMAGGGPLPGADLGAVAVLRTGPDGQMRLLRVDLGRVLAGSDLAANLVLQPLDVVIVPKSGVASLDVWMDQHVRQALPIPVRVLLEAIRHPLPPL